MKLEFETKKKIEFKHITLEDKALYDDLFSKEERVVGESERGCEFTFANLYLWGRQYFSVFDRHILIFSQFNRRSVYPYPIGIGDKKAVIEAVIEDSRARGIPCRITGLSQMDREEIDRLYPQKFRFHSDENSFDYVYSIDDLADLIGKKYDGKRNHLRRFAEACPDYTVEPITDKNIEKAREMAKEWYDERIRENPDADFHMERAAIEKAFRDFFSLGLIGIVIKSRGEIIAFTIASRMSENMLDVHFEKAVSGVQGVYAAINNEFAKYVRNKYPAVRYLNREDDMGIEGLRRAKQSYKPVRMIKKCWACLLEDGYDY